MIFRVTPAFIHIVLTKQEAASPCLLEIVTYRPIWLNFQCHAYYEISVVKVSLSNNCTIIIIGVYRPPDKSKVPEYTVKLNEILSSTSQSDHVFIVGDLNINLLDPIAIENDFVNNCHSNCLIPLINKPTRNANNNPTLRELPALIFRNWVHFKQIYI